MPRLTKRKFYRRLNRWAIVMALSLTWIGGTAALAGLLFYVLKWFAGR